MKAKFLNKVIIFFLVKKLRIYLPTTLVIHCNQFNNLNWMSSQQNHPEWWMVPKWQEKSLNFFHNLQWKLNNYVIHSVFARLLEKFHSLASSVAALFIAKNYNCCLLSLKASTGYKLNILSKKVAATYRQIKKIKYRLAYLSFVMY